MADHFGSVDAVLGLEAQSRPKIRPGGEGIVSHAGLVMPLTQFLIFREISRRDLIRTRAIPLLCPLFLWSIRSAVREGSARCHPTIISCRTKILGP